MRKWKFLMLSTPVILTTPIISSSCSPRENSDNQSVLLKQKDDEIAQLKIQIATLNAKIQTQSDFNQQLTSKEIEIANLVKQLDSKTQLLKEYEAKINQLESQQKSNLQRDTNNNPETQKQNESNSRYKELLSEKELAIKNLQKQIAALVQEKNNLERTIVTQQSELSNLKSKITQLNQLVTTLREKISSLEQQLQEKSNKTDSATNQKTDSRDSETEQTPSKNLNDENKVLTQAEINDYYTNHPEIARFNLANNTDMKFDTNRQYLDAINKRSFVLSWDFDDGTNTAGTIWLFDYHQVSENHYKLFFATNYHVAAELYHSNDYEFNSQPNRQKQITNIRLGSVNDYLEPNSRFEYKTLKQNLWPKNLFLAHNFMDQSVSNLYNARYYTEFAVIEFDYDFDTFMETDPITATPNTIEYNIEVQKRRQENKINYALKAKIEGAISELNNSISYFASGLSPMQTNKLPYATMDYGSVFMFINNDLGRDFDTNNFIEPNTIAKIKFVDQEIKKYFSNGKVAEQPYWDYFVGYPFEQNRNKVLYSPDSKLLNTIGLNEGIERNYWRTLDQGNGHVIGDHGVEFNNEPRSTFYGLMYENLVSKRIIGGASGSLVVNQDNLPIGLLFGSSGTQPVLKNDRTHADLVKSLNVAFTLNRPFYSNAINGYVQPYNIIDGTDKQKFPHQSNSYRETLIKVYGKDYQTALFKK